MKNAWLALLVACAAPAAAQTYQIDPVHSSVSFRIRHFVSKVDGRFRKFEGAFDYAAGQQKDWKAQATIDATSIWTDNDHRDDHLRSPDFFDTQRCPNIEYKTLKIEGVKDGKVKMKGDLTMHCVTRSVWLTFEVSGPMDGPDGKPRVGVSARGRINRKDFGIVWNKVLDKGGTMLGDDVDIAIELEASPAKKS